MQKSKSDRIITFPKSISEFEFSSFFRRFCDSSTTTNQVMSSSQIRSPEQQAASPILSLPEEIFIDIIARVPRCYYLTLSQVSRRFRSLVFSPELYSRRNFLNLTEQCLYVAISSDESSSEIHWFTLSGKPNRLLHIQSLPPMPSHGGYVVVGSKIFVMGGFLEKWEKATSSFSVVDCESNSVRSLPRMPKPFAESVTELVDNKVYVIGGPYFENKKSPSLMVFDIETEQWSVEMRPDWELRRRWEASVVIDGKIYMRTHYRSFVFDPSSRNCEPEDVLHTNHDEHANYWKNACVIDDFLYFYDVYENCLRFYDPKERIWRIVNGLGEGLLLPEGCSWSKSASYGDGKMALFLQKNEIWCAEIAIEKREDGEIWGEVEWCDVVLGGEFYVMNCVTVML